MSPRRGTEPPALSPTELVAHLVESVGLRTDVQALRAAEQALRGGSRPRLEAVQTACQVLGLHSTLMRGTPSDAARAVGPEHPIVGLAPDGAGFLMASGKRGSTLRFDTPTGNLWASRATVATWLDPPETGATAWVAIDPPWNRGDEHEAASSGSPPAPPKTPWARLRDLIKQQRHDVGVVIVYAVAVGLLTLAIPIAVQSLVNTVAFGTLLQPLVVITLLLFAALAFAATLRGLQTWIVEIMQRRIFLSYVSDLAYRLPRVRLSVFDSAHGPELVNRYFDIFTVQKSFAALLLQGLEIVLTTSVGLLVLAFYHPLLFVFALVFVLTVIVTLFGLGHRAVKTAVKQSKAKYAVADWLEEIARLPAAFKLSGGPELARVEAEYLATKYLKARSEHFRIVFRQTLSAFALQVIASAGILGIGGWLVIQRELTLGQLVAAELIVTAVVYSYSKIGKKLATAYDLLAALDKVGYLSDLPLDQPGSGRVPAASPAGSEVLVEKVEFSFAMGVPLFRELSLAVRPGERLALTGNKGAGRSTLAELMAGLREPKRGVVLVDGVDARDAARHENRVELVCSEATIAATIADNVAFGRAEIDSQRVRAALRTVDLLDEVTSLSEGLSTKLTPSGAPLSHGQAIRLVLARAIAGRPSLLIIDDLLDALDRSTQDKILAAVCAKDVHATVVLVTNDPRVIGCCDRELHLEHGVITSDGGGGDG